MGVAHVGLVHCDPCECKVKGFRAVSSIERNVSNRRHLQGVRQSGSSCSSVFLPFYDTFKDNSRSIMSGGERFTTMYIQTFLPSE